VNKYETSAIHKPPNNFNIIDHYNNNQNYTFNNSNQKLTPPTNSNFTSNSTNSITTNNTTTSSTLAPKPNRPVNFKEMLLENQKTIQDINKEALKDFQSLVSSELKKSLSPNPEFFQNGTNSNANIANYSNNNINNFQNKNYQNEQTNYKTTSYINVKKEDDEENDEDDSSDTMDTDSLLDDDKVETTDSSSPSKVTTANKINGENEEEPIVNSNSNFNLVKRFNFAQKHNDDDTDSNYSNHGNTATTIDPFTFLTNRTNNLSTFFANNKNYLSNGITSTNKTIGVSTTTTATAIGYNMEQQQQHKELENANSMKKKQIKSILKRSSSLDHNINVISMSNTNPVMVNFGIRATENNKNNQVKDSIELANNRIVNKKDLSDENKKDKKSVRFAAKLSEDDSKINAVYNVNNTTETSEPMITVNQIYNYQVENQNKENEQQQTPITNSKFFII
jgi:hypothetical protein